jgi:predicted nucleotide-binding protein (sugar kinase/HSP70/actin superfamily)
MTGKLLVDLKKGRNLRVRRFKKHDRLYWVSDEDKMNLTGNLRCKVEELKDKELRDYILENGTFLN